MVVTARPSYSRIKTALSAIETSPDLELQLVVAASALLDRYGETARYMEKDGFKIAARVHMVVEGENPVTMAKTAGLGLMELATAFDNLRPDAVVTIADRSETIATAVAASYMNIPLIHIQGGEVTGSIDEKVRHAITKLADLHFVATEKASERVIRMGENPDTVFVTGCPSIDLAAAVVSNPELDFDPFEKYGGVGSVVDLSQGFLVVLQHPVTTEYGAARKHVIETLYGVLEVGLPALWFWPNADAGSDGTSRGIRAFREAEQPENIRFFKNMMPKDFLRLLCNSHGIVGNSSVAIRECSFLGVRAVNIGSRQSGRDHASNVVDVDYSRQQIRDALRNSLVGKGRLQPDLLYGDGNAGKRISGLLAELPLKTEKRLRY